MDYLLGRCIVFTSVGSAASTCCSLTHAPQQDRGNKMMKKSSWVEIRTKRSFTSYSHRQNRHSIREINVIYCLVLTD